MKRTSAVIYARFSPRPNADACESVKSQVQRCQAYCERHGLRVPRRGIICDEDLSGRTTKGRQIKRVIKYCIKKRHALVVTDLDRISRNTLHALLILHRLHRGRVPLIMLDQNIDTNTDLGYLQFTLLAAFAEQYRRNCSKNTKRSMQSHRARGWAMSRWEPYGYQFGPVIETVGRDGKPKFRRTLIPNVSEQDVLAAIRRMHYSEGKTSRAISRDLNRLGFSKRNGRKWDGRSLDYIISRIEKDDSAGLTYKPEWAGKVSVTAT